MHNSSINNVAFHYVQQLNIPITETTLKESLENNPYYPSLYSLSNVFEKFNIVNEAYIIETEKLDEVTPPFIAYLKNQATGKDFVLVTSLSNNALEYLSGDNRIKTVSKDVFLKDWENIVFVAKKTSSSGEQNFDITYKKEVSAKNKTNLRIAGASLIFISILYIFLTALPKVQILDALTFFLIKTSGLAVTILLLIYEVDENSSFIKSICTAGKKTNCNAVLHSKGAKILGLSWSEAGFFYFASTLLFLLFPDITIQNKICFLAVANCIAAPYILFSLYYQWRVIKQWCLLCLSIQAALIIELIWSTINFWRHPYLPSISLLGGLLPITICLLFPIVVWHSLKFTFIKARFETFYKSAYKRLLYHPETFKHILQEQQCAPEGHQDIGIIIGNSNADNTIIKVCNPYCVPCSKTHLMLDEIIRKNKNVKVKLIFTASNESNDKRGIIAKHLLAINACQNKGLTEEAIHDWYSSQKKDYDDFARKYPVSTELKKQEIEIAKMNEWCKKAEISGTPTLFVNGYKLPEAYKVEEIKQIF